ncbi:MAG TPA: hypothetical protein VGK81_04090, partial [Anaerolineae bacterium]
MEDLNHYTLNAVISEPRGAACHYDLYAARMARRLYNQARMKAMLRGFWMRLIHQPNHLRELDAAARHMTAGNAHYAGIRAVRLSDIRGSENRLD